MIISKKKKKNYTVLCSLYIMIVYFVINFVNLVN